MVKHDPLLILTFLTREADAAPLIGDSIEDLTFISSRVRIALVKHGEKHSQAVCYMVKAPQKASHFQAFLTVKRGCFIEGISEIARLENGENYTKGVESLREMVLICRVMLSPSSTTSVRITSVSGFVLMVVTQHRVTELSKDSTFPDVGTAIQVRA